jgi:glucosamine kinase
MTGFLAVDAGGTSTRCVAVDGEGVCHGYGRAASGNPVSAGPELAARSVAVAAAAALAQAGWSGDDVGLVLLAMAGASALSEPGPFARELAALGVDAPVVFAPDLLATFCSGTWLPRGYALVAGTGATAVRVEGGAVVRAADGLGWLLGDDGSGFWIGRHVARAAAADLDGRGPRTALTGLLLGELGLAEGVGDGAGTGTRTGAGTGTGTGTGSIDVDVDVDARQQGRPAVLQLLIERLYALRPVELARFAGLAFAAAAAGDPVASAVVRDAADALVRTLDTVRDPALDGPIVLGGGTLALHPTLVARITAEHTRGGSAPEVHVVADGALGAAVIALRTASVTVDAPVFATLARSLRALRE